jgi:hypothetical protein
MTIRTENKEKEDESVVVAASAAVAMGNSNPRRNEDFPDVFYCPLTEKIMVDPVVDTSGKSFERSAVTAKDKRDNVTGVIYYPNRALKTIIKQELERDEHKGSLRGRVEESLRSGFGRLVKKPTRPLPDSFYCSITLELIREPVIDPDGRTFERDAIFNWIRANGTSPVTRNTLEVSQLRSNEALRALMEDEKERTDESLHPSIRRWKMEDQTAETGSILAVNPPVVSPDRVDGLNNNAIHATAPGAERDNGINQNYTTTQAGNNQNHQLQPTPVSRDQQNNPTTQAEIDAMVVRLRQLESESARCTPKSAKSMVGGIISLIFILMFFLRRY